MESVSSRLYVPLRDDELSLTSAPRDLNQIMNPANQPSLNRTFASQTDIVCPDGTTCIYAFPESGCSSSSNIDPVMTEIVDGPNNSCAPWSQDISFPVISVLFWLGDQGAQSITFYNAQNCTDFQLSSLTTDPFQWSCYSISPMSANNGGRLLSYKALYS